MSLLLVMMSSGMGGANRLMVSIVDDLFWCGRGEEGRGEDCASCEEKEQL